MYQNDFLGLNFGSLGSGAWPAPPIEGKMILTTIYDVDLSRSKWWDLAVLVVMVVGYRILFVLMVKLSRAYNMWRRTVSVGVPSTAPTSTFPSEPASVQELESASASCVQTPYPDLRPSLFFLQDSSH